MKRPSLKVIIIGIILVFLCSLDAKASNYTISQGISDLNRLAYSTQTVWQNSVNQQMRVQRQNEDMLRRLSQQRRDSQMDEIRLKREILRLREDLLRMEQKYGK